MRSSLLLSLTAISALAASAAFVAPASALTMTECSAKYKAAQTDGSAKDTKWNDFRKAQCGADATAEPEVSANSKEEPVKASAPAPKGVTFPRSIAAKYASESPGRGRMHTCVDEYHVNKAANTLGGLHWIQKGGGYYSLCSAKLKGSS